MLRDACAACEAVSSLSSEESEEPEEFARASAAYDEARHELNMSNVKVSIYGNRGAAGSVLGVPEVESRNVPQAPRQGGAAGSRKIYENLELLIAQQKVARVLAHAATREGMGRRYTRSRPLGDVSRASSSRTRGTRVRTSPPSSSAAIRAFSR